MDLTLQQACSDNLIQKISEALNSVTVSYGTHIDFASLLSLFNLDESLPNREYRETVQEYIGEPAVFDFVVTELGQRIRDKFEYSTDKNTKNLTDLEGFEDIDSLATDLVNKFQTLPYSYVFTVSLNNKIVGDLPKGSYQLGPTIKLIRPDDEFAAKFPFPENGGSTSLLGIATPGSSDWDQDKLYLQLEIDGYFTGLSQSGQVDRCRKQTKSIVGMLIAERLVKVTSSTNTVSESKRDILVHREEGDDYHFVSQVKLDTNLASLIAGLEFDSVNDSLTTTEQFTRHIQTTAEKIDGAMRAPQEIVNRLTSSSRWLVDGYIGDNNLLGFIQTTVALEILLGDKAESDDIGLNKLLSNRCAYLISKDHEQRKDTLKKFRAIYDIRSRIVHRGQESLKSGERVLFQHLRWMVGRVLQEEMKQAKA